jgi:hypothetical protein
MVKTSKAANPKRKKAEEQIYALMNDFDPSGRNSDAWFIRFSSMSDKQFGEMMKDFSTNPRKFHLTIDQDSGDPNTEVTFDKIEKIAKKHNVKLYEYVFFPHENPDDPEHPFCTATPVPILFLFVRKLQQMLTKKNDASSDIDSINPLTGQVIGESKSASLSDTLTSALTTTNQQETIKELLTIRADNMPGKTRMLNQIEANGTVNYKDCDVKYKDSQALQTFWVFMKGALLKTDVLDEV